MYPQRKQEKTTLDKWFDFTIFLSHMLESFLSFWWDSPRRTHEPFLSFWWDSSPRKIMKKTFKNINNSWKITSTFLPDHLFLHWQLRLWEPLSRAIGTLGEAQQFNGMTCAHGGPMDHLGAQGPLKSYWFFVILEIVRRILWTWPWFRQWLCGKMLGWFWRICTDFGGVAAMVAKHLKNDAFHMDWFKDKWKWWLETRVLPST